MRMMTFRLYITTGTPTKDKLIKQTKGPEQNAPGLFRLYGGKGFFAPVAALDNDWFFLYNTLNVWGILRDTEDIFRETKTGT